MRGLITASRVDERTRLGIARIFKEFTGELRLMAVKTKKPISAFSPFRPHNLFLGLDKRVLHAVLSFTYAIPGIVQETIVRLRSSSKIEHAAVLEFCTTKLGYREVVYFALPAALLEQEEEERKKTLKVVVREEFGKELERLRLVAQPLEVPLGSLRRFLEDASHGEVIEGILVPLFTKMGFEILERQTSPSLHLWDIRMNYWLPTGHSIRFAVELQTTKGKKIDTRDLESVLSRPDSDYRFENQPFYGQTSQPVDQVYLVALAGLTAQASVLLQSHRISGKARVHLIDRNRLIDLCDRWGLPMVTQEKAEGITE